MPEETSAQPVSPPASRRGGLRLIPAGLSAALCLFVGICYALRTEAVSAVTVWPVWLWGLPGLLLAVCALRRRKNRPVLSVIGLWLLYGLVFAEEPRSLLRFRSPGAAEWQAARAQGQALRVISLNCAGGSIDAAREVKSWHPDIVLLQESPPRKEIEKVAYELFGTEAGVVPGLDASLIVHGSAEPAPLPANSPRLAHFVEAHVRLPSGFEAEVFSTRLLPNTVRIDLWSPDCWRAYADIARAHHEELNVLAGRIALQPAALPILVGGDFNMPQKEGSFAVFQPRLHDTFGEGGTGWGNTIINELPLLRIDQIWASSTLQAGCVRAHRTRYSDHRMVVCDLFILGLARR